VNVAKVDIQNNFSNVTEQSAIKAGDGGFTVTVQGDTNLLGGAITSTQAAIDAKQNTFQTGGTLSTTNIQNKANYEAASVSTNLIAGNTPLPGQSVSAGQSGIGYGEKMAILIQ